MIAMIIIIFEHNINDEELSLYLFKLDHSLLMSSSKKQVKSLLPYLIILFKIYWQKLFQFQSKHINQQKLDMIKLTSVVAVCLLLSIGSSALIFLSGIPINQTVFLKAQVALDKWEQQLNRNYNTSKENPKTIKSNTDLVKNKLDAVSKQLSAYNNVVVGSQNAVLGSKNIIMGNSNKVMGAGNFVLTSNFNSLNRTNAPANSFMTNTLVNDRWIAELERRDQIPTALHSVIYPW